MLPAADEALPMSPALADAIFWIAVGCCAAAELAIVRSALARRAEPTAGSPVPGVRRGAEVVWAVVPALILAAVLFATWRAMHPSPPRGTDTDGVYTAASDSRYSGRP